MMYDNKSNIKKQAKGNVTYGSNIVLSVINLATKEIARNAENLISVRPIK